VEQNPEEEGKPCGRRGRGHCQIHCDAEAVNRTRRGVVPCRDQDEVGAFQRRCGVAAVPPKEFDPKKIACQSFGSASP